ncbi:MAG: creatininase family protein [Thermoanaerobaculales bacterium]|jgi:creatinine amidohydrolase/Fe(II)-dependent formamide hydrolase-like protein|nr:creatininase family protein [Thermoanaerobaculales bacterium]
MAPTIESLVVIDRLEVGPVEVGSDKITAPYRVVVGSEEHATELIYRWEEGVFDPDDPACRNLASIIAAQLALNYGLFCSEIVFHGSFDRHDRRLLKEMAANTAREIYVKKLLEPNPFLVPEAAGLPADKRKSYLQAELVFPDAAPKRFAAWQTDESRHAILSSGGKESLLGYSIIDELGYETHPIFVNESGRHWFTALNAYRHFNRDVPNTARVWTNCDRLFSWMLRHLPFIRPDFASVRNDEYPIRLWTVAVFLFGVLPLLRKRGIGRILIGDEFDTTCRAYHQGIPHYDGLYDQSRFFDQRLTRYFEDKGFGVVQFSILRSLSELLVEKILVERYPDLQRLQTSCHATHSEGDRVLPCGKCEKCRRVVAMLSALGADPATIGYRPDQIERCLRTIASKGVHQEGAGERQLLAMLVEQQLLPAGTEITRRVKPHPEVLEVRIDPERSPLDGIPVDLRRGLLQILLEHAHGASRRLGRKWLPAFPLDDPELFSPCRFELPDPTDEPTDTAARRHLLGELTWPEAEERFREVDVVLLPVGAIEQHGPHLTLDTDAFDADYLARRVAEACSDPKPLVLPLIPYGVSYHHDDFPGTISISNEALSKIVYDIGMSCTRHGVTKIIIINGHGGNLATLKYAAQMINRDANVFTSVDTGETSDVDLDQLCETENDVHAGEVETSTSLAIRPDLVNMELAEAFVPQFSSRYLDFTARRSVEWFARTARISPNGVMGDPTRASAEKGAQMWRVMIANLVEFVEEIKGMSLDEIYERRY